jgi:hypothetical protein
VPTRDLVRPEPEAGVVEEIAGHAGNSPGLEPFVIAAKANEICGSLTV